MSKGLDVLQEIKDIRALIYEHYDECNKERVKSRDVFIRYCNYIEKELKDKEKQENALKTISDIIRDFNKGEFASGEIALQEITSILSEVLL